MTQPPHLPPDDTDIELDASGTAPEPVPWELQRNPHLCSRLFGEEPTAPRVAISADALLDMLGHGVTESRREVGGIVVGMTVLTAEGPLVRVDDMIIADSPEASQTHVTFTHDSWDGVYRALDQRDDHLRIIGWYHTHPGFGPFLSAHDLFIHNNFFNSPEHLAIVLDPVQGLFSVFGWGGGEVSRLAGCWAFCPVSEAAELDELGRRLKYVAEPVHGGGGEAEMAPILSVSSWPRG